MKLTKADLGTRQCLDQMKSNYEQLQERVDAVEFRIRVLVQQQDGFSARAAKILERATAFTGCDCYIFGMTNDIYCPTHNPREENV